jgi:hypothetical protein
LDEGSVLENNPESTASILLPYLHVGYYVFQFRKRLQNTQSFSVPGLLYQAGAVTDDREIGPTLGSSR